MKRRRQRSRSRWNRAMKRALSPGRAEWGTEPNAGGPRSLDGELASKRCRRSELHSSDLRQRFEVSHRSSCKEHPVKHLLIRHCLHAIAHTPLLMRKDVLCWSYGIAHIACLTWLLHTALITRHCSRAMAHTPLLIRHCLYALAHT